MHKLRTSFSVLNKLATGARLQLQSTDSAGAATQAAKFKRDCQERVSQPQEENADSRVGGIPFSRSKVGVFFQEQPRVDNQFLEDVTLQKYLHRVMPEQVIEEIKPDLEQFGERVTTDILELSIECENQRPTLKHYNAWGQRIDEIITCDAWKQMKGISAQEGLVAIAYERKYAQWSRLYQMAKLYLYAPSGGLYTCPLAMLDGAARSLEVLGDQWMKERPYKSLTSRDPHQVWTSGQWMTERRGGSDVARGTETIAVPQPDGSYKLYGYKWFTSATDSEMALTLARIPDADGQVIQGTRGITMFYLEVRDKQGRLNNMEVPRLKDKLGTKQLPTSELLLDGTVAYKVGEEGRGIPSISNMLTLTRLHNSAAAVGSMRRMVNLARDYSAKRQCFGKKVKDFPLHMKVLASMEVEQRGALLLVLELARLLGREECTVASEQDKLLVRLMTPVAKLYTAKQSVALASEGLECFGGQGYMEDTDIPRMLRDAQVLPIWEGTTNILSLDVLRAITKTNGAVLQTFHKDVQHRVSAVRAELQGCADKLQQAADDLIGFIKENPDKMELAAREYAYGIGRTFIGALLVEHANGQDADHLDILTAQRWCSRDMVPFLKQDALGNYSPTQAQAEYDLVMQGYPSSKL